jgi:hypothetical protein
MIWLKYRRYMGIARSAMGIARRLTEVWNFTRKYQHFTIDTYQRIVKIAQQKDIPIPKTKINMTKE